MEVDQFVRSNLDEFEAKLAKNDLALDVIVGTGSSLSILGSASIIITTLIFHKLQKHCFSLRLILYVQPYANALVLTLLSIKLGLSRYAISSYLHPLFPVLLVNNLAGGRSNQKRILFVLFRYA